MGPRTKIVIIVAALALAAAAAYHFLWRAVTVTVVEARIGEAVEAVYATGTVEPVRWARVSPTVTARLVEIRFDDGDRVVADQVLARLDDEALRAELVEKQARLRFLTAELERYRRLAEREVASRAKYEEVLAAYEEAIAAVDARVERLREYEIRAPMDGVILERDGEVGEVVAPGQVLFWVGRTWPLRVAAEIDEEDIPRVRLGQVALIKADAFPGTVFEGEIGEITPRGDPVSKSYRVEISLPYEHVFKDAATTEINIVVMRRPHAVLVPTAALVDGVVWTVDDERARAVAAEPGIVGTDWVEIVDGLGEGTPVVVDPPAGLAAGDRVQVAPMEESTD